jgi:hypothetical protein
MSMRSPGGGSGQLNNSSAVNRSSPVQVGGLTSWLAASTGSQTFAVKG